MEKGGNNMATRREDLAYGRTPARGRPDLSGRRSQQGCLAACPGALRLILRFLSSAARCRAACSSGCCRLRIAAAAGCLATCRYLAAGKAGSSADVRGGEAWTG
jgi:hypothetical protein